MCLCYAPVCYVTKRVVVFRGGGKRHSQSMLFCSCISLYASLDSVQEECLRQRDVREGGRLVQGTAIRRCKKSYMTPSFEGSWMELLSLSTKAKDGEEKRRGRKKKGKRVYRKKGAVILRSSLVYRLAFLSLFFRESLSLSSSFSLLVP